MFNINTGHLGVGFRYKVDQRGQKSNKGKECKDGSTDKGGLITDNPWQSRILQKNGLELSGHGWYKGKNCGN